ncbi:hypothetical protein [Moorena sp. SIO4G3]|uniref:hypothetical protein n=1 Tax=Moorena sp. SIO4G3 TaxID=2607821 RepID=UPI0025F10B6A|nr:hypothetical protein [Moorena sp. SIO4G3]
MSLYLARRYGSEDWLPLEPEAMSRVMRWLSTTAGEIRQGPEFARLYQKILVIAPRPYRTAFS